MEKVYLATLVVSTLGAFLTFYRHTWMAGEREFLPRKWLRLVENQEAFDKKFGTRWRQDENIKTVETRRAFLIGKFDCRMMGSLIVFTLGIFLTMELI